MSETHTDLAHEVALANGAAADTNITVPRITDKDVIKSIYTFNGDATAPTAIVWTVADLIANLTVVGAGVIQLGVDTTGDVLVILFNKANELGRSLVDPADPLYAGP